ncbi:MAG: nicotinate (nicotinamide) nucleotide adenylyltransferase [Calditrichaeota bacterium]|nr:nicotinate (nicotinamide) nucleotide adenylyltransferase [Calditrichota bacterium]
MKKVNNSIGLFGGTFDPPHIGHMVVAEWLSEVLEIEKTFFIPTKIHPLKKRPEISTSTIRKEMITAVLQDYANFELSTFEIDRDTISYTIDTIKHFKTKYPQSEIFYLIGADNLDSFLQWKDPFQILELCYLVVYNRGTKNEKNDLIDHPKVLTIESPLIEISSSHVRKRIAKQMPFRSLVPHQVFQYITQNKLYKNNS